MIEVPFPENLPSASIFPTPFIDKERLSVAIERRRFFELIAIECIEML